MIVPAIIPQSFDQLRDVVDEISVCTREVQIDIVDGRFVPFTSWPYRGSGSVMLLREFTEAMNLEMDLMIEDPERAVLLYAEAGVKRIVVHLEGVTRLDHIREVLAEYGCKLGLSISNDSPISLLTDVLTDHDYVQLMGIKDIGTQGQPFDERVLLRAKELRTQYPLLELSVDGSVNRETLPKLKEVGVNRFVVGSAIMSAENPVFAYRELSNL